MQINMIVNARPFAQLDAINGKLDGIQSNHYDLHQFAFDAKEKCEMMHESHNMMN
jgi:hypothetical protein